MGYPQPRHPDPLTQVPFGGDLVTPEQRAVVLEQLIATRERVIAVNGYATAIWSDPESAHPPVAYTVGLLERFNHAELVLVGVSTDREIGADGDPAWSMAHMILGILATRIVRDGLRLAAGQTLATLFPPDAEAERDEGGNGGGGVGGGGGRRTRTARSAAPTRPTPPAFPVTLRAVHPSRYDPFLVQALVRYGTDLLRALQVVIADEAGSFPWEVGCDPVLVAAEELLDGPAPRRAPWARLRTPEAQAQAALAQMVHERAQTMAWLQQSARAIIDRHGWLVQGVFGSHDLTRPKAPHAYTIGLLERFAHPELVIVGVDPQTGAPILNALGKAVRDGHPFTDGEVYAGLGGQYPVVLRTVHPSRFPTWCGRGLVEHEQSSAGADGIPYAALQVVLTDPHGFLPWDVEADASYHAHQTLLYEATADPDEY
jgi:hypothetical protein